MRYKELNQEERYYVYEGNVICKSLRKIAKELKRYVSTLAGWLGLMAGLS